MTFSLMPHQIEDAAFLASRPFAGCFNDMGSGKTRTALEACRLVEARRVIIVAPPIALPMWQREFKDHCGTRAQIVPTGKTPLEDVDAYILSYDIARKRALELRALGADVLIMDESHALKNVKAKRTKAMLGKGGLCETVKHTWVLTGTPITKWADDLFPFLCRAGADRLKEKIGGLSMEKFLLRYCVVQQRRFNGSRVPVRLVVGDRNQDELREMLFSGDKPLACRRLMEEVYAAMPPLTCTQNTVPLEMTADLRAALKHVEKMSARQIEEALRQKEESLSTARRLIGLGKVKASVEEIAERVEAGQGPLLVLGWHVEVLKALVTRLQAKGVKAEILYGGTSPKDKEALEAAFNAGSIDVLCGQVAAMGVSLNMQGGCRAIVVERDWSPAVMDQAIKRLWRYGQERHVHVDYFDSDNKLDDAVRKIGGRKAASHKSILGDAR